MARKKAAGLPWFKHDTALDEKFKLIQLKYGNDGYAFVFKLYEKIYQTENLEINMADTIYIESLAYEFNLHTVSRFMEILEYAIHLGFFSKDAYIRRILTSDGIKKRGEAFFLHRKSAAKRLTKYRKNRNGKQFDFPLSNSSNIYNNKEREYVTGNNSIETGNNSIETGNNSIETGNNGIVTGNNSDGDETGNNNCNGKQSIETGNNSDGDETGNNVGGITLNQINSMDFTIIYYKFDALFSDYVKLNEFDKKKIAEVVKNPLVWEETIQYWQRSKYYPKVDRILDNYTRRIDKLNGAKSSTSVQSPQVTDAAPRPQEKAKEGFVFFADLAVGDKFILNKKAYIKVSRVLFGLEEPKNQAERTLRTFKNVWTEVENAQ